MYRISLDGLWNGRYVLENQPPVDFSARVPGCAHTDLQREGIIPDYFKGYGVQECQFIEKAYFTYTKTFEFNGSTNGMQLLFEGLDTYCDVYLNGEKLGFCDDMFIPFAFDVSNVLKNGKNDIKVCFFPPVEQVKDLPKLGACFSEDRENIRRIQCTFGWDWVDRFVTMGVFDHVWLQRPSDTEIDSVYIATTDIDECGAALYLQVDFERVRAGSMALIEMFSPDGDMIWTQRRCLVEKSFFEYVSVSEPQLWFPNGYGKQPLYRVSITVSDDNGEILSQKQTSFGIRTLRILEIEDAPGSVDAETATQLCEQGYIKAQENGKISACFTVLVNGKKIFCKGADFAPCEPFPSDAKPEKYRVLLKLAADAHVNMLRVWGGGIFEKDVFYEECDRLGILVTQDFLMACAVYPEKQEWFKDKIRLEAVHVAKRLRNHPSLAWWTGDNENSSLGDLELPDYTGRTIAYEISKILRELDPYRRFMPSSPYGGKPFKSTIRGISHNTFFLEDYGVYVQNNDLRDYQQRFKGTLTRFNNEIPLMGLPAFSSIARFEDNGSYDVFDDACLRFHSKNHPAPVFNDFGMMDVQIKFAECVLGNFKDDCDKMFKMQAMQYELVRQSMECYRRNKWYSSGILFWMFSDCWPANSGALIDYYANPKSGYYAFKNFAKPITVCITEENGVYKVYAMNDSLEYTELSIHLYVQDMYGKTPLWEIDFVCSVSANSSSVVWQGEVILPKEGAVLLCDAQTVNGPYRAVYFPCRVSDLVLPSASGKIPVEIVERTDTQITLQATAYAHMVALDGDYCFSDNFFIMTPKERRTVSFTRTHTAQSDEISLHVL